MPIINIHEKDETTSRRIDTTDIPLIISKRTYKNTKGDAINDGKPKLYSNLSSFLDDYPNCDGETTNYDPAYIMAGELINKGMPVYFAHADFSDIIKNDGIDRDYVLDRNEMTIKYIAIPEIMVKEPFNQAKDMWLTYAELCEHRGDCIYLLDVTDEFDFTTIKADIELFVQSETSNYIDAEFECTAYAACFGPWHSYEFTTGLLDKNNTKIIRANLPGSFAYLNTVANNLYKVNNWLAVAGVSRGLVPNIKDALVRSGRVITNTVADSLQPRSADDKPTYAINPITNVNPYGYTIWGNRTLKVMKNISEPLAAHFLNTRNMLSDIKKVAYNTAKSLMFDQVDEVLWLNFISGVSPYLEKLKTGAGISDYKLIRLPDAKRGELKCNIKIYPLYAVEAFDIYITASDAAEVDVK